MNDTSSRPTWDRFFLGMADYIATRSKDPRTQVGAVIVNEHNQVLGMGYNGFPAGIYDKPEILASTDKHDFMVHAEMNAILNCSVSPRGHKLYITHTPCKTCAAMVIQAGISSICCWAPTAEWEERYPLPISLLCVKIPVSYLHRE